MKFDEGLEKGGTTDQNECKYCVSCQDNSSDCEDGQVNPADTTQWQ